MAAASPRGVGPCCCPPARAPPAGPTPHSPLPTRATMLLTGAADSLWRGAEGLGARARCGSPHGSRPHLCTTRSSAHRRSTAIEVAAALRLYTVAGGCPAWRLGCPSLTDAVVWPAGGRTPDRSRLLHPRRTSSPNVFSKSSTRRIRKFPERQGSAPDPAPACAWGKVSPGGFSPGVLGTITALADRSLRFWKRR